MEQIVVGVEQFLILVIIWRLWFYQYWRAAYNIKKFTMHMKKQVGESADSLQKVNLLQFKLDLKLKRESEINFIAIIVFALYSSLIAVSYLQNLIKNSIFQNFKNGLLMFFTLVLYGVGGWYFYKATQIFE